MSTAAAPAPDGKSKLAIIQPLSPLTEEMMTPCGVRSDDRLDLCITRDLSSFSVRIYSENDSGDSEYAPSYYAGAWASLVPERKRQAGAPVGDHWSMAATDVTALLVYAHWDHSQIRFYDEETRLYYNFLIARFTKQLGVMKAKAEYKTHGILPPVPEGMLEHDDKPMMGHQRLVTYLLPQLEYAAVFYDKGTGKTPIAVTHVCHQAMTRKDKSKPYRVLVVCPNNIRTNWVNEFERFATCRGKIAVARGPKYERMRVVADVIRAEEDCEYAVCVAGYEGVVGTLLVFHMVEWDLIILDEGHAIKSPFTKRTKEFHKLRDRAKRRIIMTGDPITNSPLDLYAQLEFLAPGLSGFSSYKAFRKFYAKIEQTQFGDRITGWQNLPIMQERIARIAFDCRKEEVLVDLPSKQYQTVEVEMGPKQAELYKLIQEQLKVEIAAEQAARANSSNQVMVVDTILSKLLRLAQVTAGVARWSDQINETGDLVKGKVELLTDNPKLEAVMEDILLLRKNEKAIMWCCFVPAIQLLSERLAFEGIRHVTFYGATREKDREEAVRQFNCEDGVKVFIGNPAAAGEGLNLLGYDWKSSTPGDTNVSLMGFFCQNWSMVQRSQAEDRAHRSGTRVPLIIKDYVIPGTIDEEIRRRVTGMIKQAKDLRDVEHILHAVLDYEPPSF